MCEISFYRYGHRFLVFIYYISKQIWWRWLVYKENNEQYEIIDDSHDERKDDLWGKNDLEREEISFPFLSFPLSLSLSSTRRKIKRNFIF